MQRGTLKKSIENIPPLLAVIFGSVFLWFSVLTVITLRNHHEKVAHTTTMQQARIASRRCLDKGRHPLIVTIWSDPIGPEGALKPVGWKITCKE